MASRTIPSGSGETVFPSGPTQSKRKRVALGRTPHRLSFERRLRFWLFGFCAVIVLLLTVVSSRFSEGFATPAVAALLATAISASLASILFQQIIRPLQTLANIVVALREDDFSFRARGARRGDAMGDLALEINLLAGSLQQQRTRARDAVSLAERVITAMPSPVLAFEDSGVLRFLNEAAEQFLQVPAGKLTGQTAKEIGLEPLLHLPNGGIFTAAPALTDSKGATTATTRWSVRRTSFRLAGVPHTLLVLSDVAAALREEERIAWQRLIRVLGHEINNSLAPISSIAGSLRSRLCIEQTGTNADLHRGLGIIEDRAEALHRFLLAYQRLSKLPSPTLQPTQLPLLLERVCLLETRLPVHMLAGEAVELLADADQLQQMLINLVHNAVDAALQVQRRTAEDSPRVEVTWRLTASEVVIRIRDNGHGVANPRNLFVPFYTTKPQGSGIGLVLAQQIATAHHGSITLTSRSDHHGCDAEVYLPRQTEGSSAGIPIRA